jgi:hypothetical protein|tara:strand:- start:1494 stop:1685 length:192 start_codon:yes stop_codon:yes gene_type:complete
MNKFQSDLQKAKILLTVVTINGTLYEGEVVKVERPENGDYRVRDATGKIWYVSKDNVELLNKK